MIRLKEGVTWDGLEPDIFLGLAYIYWIFRENGLLELIVTSTKEDSKEHKVTSKHYLGQAVDIRTHGILQNTKYLILKLGRVLVKPLGYDFIIEFEGTEREHFHLEYDPK